MMKNTSLNYYSEFQWGYRKGWVDYAAPDDDDDDDDDDGSRDKNGDKTVVVVLVSLTQ